ncbi:MAG: type III pantothenate kinase [Thermoanaerobaculia bacterium]
MLIVIDLGNTNADLGVFRGEELVAHFRLGSDRERTSDEYGATVASLLRSRGLAVEEAEGVVVSSVVPQLTPAFVRLAREYLGREPLVVEPGVKTGLPIRSDNPAEVGADRIVNALAARERYGAPVVVVDFGTATTFDVVNAAGEYVGGIIAPGLTISADALVRHASRLFQVDIRKPAQVVGRTTVGAMQSGLYYGYAGLVDGILDRLFEEVRGLRTVVATGGNAPLIAEASRHIHEIAPNLTLEGLRLIHERTR